MKKALILAGVAVGVALLARRVAHGCNEFSFERMIERMPEDAPPKWMFRNVTAIRANTELILERLPSEQLLESRTGEPTLA